MQPSLHTANAHVPEAPGLQRSGHRKRTAHVQRAQHLPIWAACPCAPTLAVTCISGVYLCVHAHTCVDACTCVRACVRACIRARVHVYLFARTQARAPVHGCKCVPAWASATSYEAHVQMSAHAFCQDHPGTHMRPCTHLRQPS